MDLGLMQRIDVKLMGYVRCIRAVILEMRAQGGGRIINPVLRLGSGSVHHRAAACRRGGTDGRNGVLGPAAKKWSGGIHMGGGPVEPRGGEPCNAE